MEIKIKSIGDKGDLSNERIGLEVLKNSELKYYLLFMTSKTDNGFSNQSNKTYWFIPQKVTAGDNIVIYSKSGKPSIKPNPDGTKTHFLYWGLNESMFNSDKAKVVLINANSYQTF